MADIEISKDGLKIPYRWFMADTASGLSLYLIVYAVYIWGGFDFMDSYKSNINKIGESTGIFLFIILFFLATAFGGILSAISWFLLGNSTTRFYRKMFSCRFEKEKNWWHRFMVWINSRNYRRYQFETYKSFFGLTKDNWEKFYFSLGRVYRFSGSVRKKIDLNLDSVAGGISYIRNMLIVSGSAFLFCIYHTDFSNACILLLVSIFLFFLGAVEENYHINNIFQITYIYLVNKIEPEEINGDFTKIQKLLLVDDTKIQQ